MNQFSFYCTMYHLGIIVIVPLAFSAPAIYHSYQAGAFRSLNLEGIDVELAIYFHYPGFNCLDYFYILTIINIYFTYIGCISIFTVDSFLSLIVFQIIGHIRILKHNMEYLPRPKKVTTIQVPGRVKENYIMSWYDEDENKNIHNVLVGMIKYHKNITR